MAGPFLAAILGRARTWRKGRNVVSQPAQAEPWGGEVPDFPDRRLFWAGDSAERRHESRGRAVSGVKSRSHPTGDGRGYVLKVDSDPRLRLECHGAKVTTLRHKLVKIGAKMVHHAGYVVFQMAEVVVPRDLFGNILERITRPRLEPG